MTGHKLRIDWGRTASGAYIGYYEWDLDASCNQGSGYLVRGGGRDASTVKRAAQQQTQFDTGGGGGAAGGFVCTALAGVWTQQSENGGRSTWNITAAGEAAETGLGHAKGTATLKGRKLRIDWRTPSGAYSGYYEWDLDSSCVSGSGVLVFLSGASGSQKSTVRK